MSAVVSRRRPLSQMLASCASEAKNCSRLLRRSSPLVVRPYSFRRSNSVDVYPRSVVRSSPGGSVAGGDEFDLSLYDTDLSAAYHPY